MADFLPIVYRDFYDVPRLFIVTDAGVSYLFDSSFDEASDDYSSYYSVSILPPLALGELDASWVSLPNRAVSYLGDVPISEVRFDETKRRSIERTSLRSVINGAQPAVGDWLTLDGQPVDPSIIKAVSLNEGWIEVSEFVTPPNGGRKLQARMDADGEAPIVHRKFGNVRRRQPAS